MRLAKVKRVISSVLGEIPLKEGGSTFKPSGYKRDTVPGETSANTGFTESTAAAELKLSVQATMDVSVFAPIDNDSLTIFLDGGGQHMMPGAWVTETPELGNGEFTLL